MFTNVAIALNLWHVATCQWSNTSQTVLAN
jgi:hypothetical protein